MAHKGKTIVTLLLGTAIGITVGYFLSTDADDREETFGSLKEKLNDTYFDLKNRFSKPAASLEEEIYNV